jgi:hypothetical protein
MDRDLGWVVLKFGGTSVATAERWAIIAGRVERRLAEGRRPLVVCSALAGVSNRLEEMLALAVAGSHQEALAEIRERHLQLGEALGLPAGDVLRADLEELARLALGAALLGDAGAPLRPGHGLRRAASRRSSAQPSNASSIPPLGSTPHRAAGAQAAGPFHLLLPAASARRRQELRTPGSGAGHGRPAHLGHRAAAPARRCSSAAAVRHLGRRARSSAPTGARSDRRARAVPASPALIPGALLRWLDYDEAQGSPPPARRSSIHGRSRRCAGTASRCTSCAPTGPRLPAR